MKRNLLKDLNQYNNELVELDGKLFQIKFELLTFYDMDRKIIHKLKDEFLADKNAQTGMELMKVPEIKQLEQFGMCRYGGLDNQPDFEGDIVHPEWHDCGRRGNCPGEGLVCKSMKVKNGLLSPRLIQYLQLLCQGMTDQEIADHLNVAITTAKTFKARCMDATDCRTKTELTAWAKDRGIA
jgi:DNA-binding CsgD family transcriptional regulator